MERESWSVDGEYVDSELPQVPVTSQMSFWGKSSKAIAHGRQSKQPIDLPVPEELEPPARSSPHRKSSRKSSAGTHADTSFESASTIAEWAASTPSMRSQSSVDTCFSSSEEVYVSSCPGDGTVSSKPRKNLLRLPRPTFLSSVVAGGARLQKSLHSQFRKDSSACNTPQIARSARRKKSLEPQCAKEASGFQKMASAMRALSPTRSRASSAHAEASMFVIDDTTSVPEDVAMSLLSAASCKRDGQHIAVSRPKPRLVNRGRPDEYH